MWNGWSGKEINFGVNQANLTKTWLSLRSSGMRSKQNLVFSPLLFRFNEGSLNTTAAHFLFKILNMGISGFYTARLACLTLRTRSRMIDVNCQNWPITGYTSSLYTRKSHCNNASPSFPSLRAVFAQLFSIRFSPTILKLWSATLLRIQIKGRA